jgi:uncharacterized protein (TIGR02757 family)
MVKISLDSSIFTNIYSQHGGLETVFCQIRTPFDANSISNSKKFFYPSSRSNSKHVSDPLNNSAAKRINMYLRWMVRNDKLVLICPGKTSQRLPYHALDVHSGNVARKLGLLTRKQNDGKFKQN